MLSNFRLRTFSHTIHVWNTYMVDFYGINEERKIWNNDVSWGNKHVALPDQRQNLPFNGVHLKKNVRYCLLVMQGFFIFLGLFQVTDSANGQPLNFWWWHIFGNIKFKLFCSWSFGWVKVIMAKHVIIYAVCSTYVRNFHPEICGKMKPFWLINMFHSWVGTNHHLVVYLDLVE